MPKTTTKPNPMSQDELFELQIAVAQVYLQDIGVGRVLDTIVSHLARLNGFDYPVVKQNDTAPEQAPADQAPTQEGV